MIGFGEGGRMTPGVRPEWTPWEVTEDGEGGEGRPVGLGDAEFAMPLRHPADTGSRSRICLSLLRRVKGPGGIFSQGEPGHCAGCAHGGRRWESPEGNQRGAFRPAGHRGRPGPARASIRAAGRMVGSEAPCRELWGEWTVTLSSCSTRASALYSL